MVFAPVVFDGATHVGDDSAQLVRPDMGVGVDGYSGVGTVFYKALQHIVDVSTLGAARVQLPVGVGTRTPFAETPVALRVHLSRPS